MRFNPVAMRDVAAADKAPAVTPGLVLLKSVQIFNPGGQVGVQYPSITVDIPEAPFSKFRRVMVQFSAIGFANTTAVALRLTPRKNGGALPITTYYQYSAASGSATNTWSNTNSVTPLLTSGLLTNTQNIRTLDLWMDAYGYDSYVAVGANTTLATASMFMGTGTYTQTTGQQTYGPNDYPGFTLDLNSSNYFCAPTFNGVNPPAAVFCDIYGWAIK